MTEIAKCVSKDARVKLVNVAFREKRKEKKNGAEAATEAALR